MKTFLGLAAASLFVIVHAAQGDDITKQFHNSSWVNFAAATDRNDAYAAPTFSEVFLPKNESDVARALKYLSSNKLPFLFGKTGGHGYSTTLDYIQNGTFINMKHFNYSRNNGDGTITFGAGASFQDMITAEAAAGREMTLGSCPCVGGTGAMLGGGLGRYQGLYGLTSDAVRKIRMVLYNGTIIEASNTSHADLYWGMRGAGQNFGAVIETTFQTYAFANGGNNYQADMTFTVGNVTKMIDTLNSLIPLPAPLALLFVVASDPTTLEPVVALNLIYNGPKDKGKSYSDRFAPYAATYKSSSIKTKDLLIDSAGGVAVRKCLNGQNHVMSGAVTKLVNSTSYSRLVRSYRDFVHKHPAVNQSTLLIETFGQQGIDAYPADYDAFPHRGQFNNMVEWEIAFDNTPDDDALATAAYKWSLGWRDHFASPAIGGYDPPVTYQNYAHGDEPLGQIYGFEKWRQERLTKLKNMYDPNGSFNAYHAVPSTLAGWTQPQIGYNGHE